MARILVVDDDNLSRSIFRELLEEAGHQVVEAKTSGEGVRCFRQFEIDLVVTDLFMPEHGGMEVIEGVQSLDPEVGVIAVSGIALDNKGAIFEQAEQAGADYTLEKPVNPEVLRQAVESLLGDADSG